MLEGKDKSMSELIGNSSDTTSSISKEELVEMGKLWEEYLKRNGIRQGETIVTLESGFLDYLKDVYSDTTITNENLTNQSTISSNEKMKEIEDKWKKYFEGISTKTDSKLTNEELAQRILEINHGFSFNSGTSDSWKDYEEIDATPEEIGKSK